MGYFTGIGERSVTLAASPSIVLAFGPFDPSGADGLPADAVTCGALGCHGLSVLSGILVQDSTGPESAQALSPELIDDQARSLLEDMPVQAFKAGAVYTPEAASVIAQIAADYSETPLVLHLGAGLLPTGDAAEADADEALHEAILELLLPQAHITVVEHHLLTRWLDEGLLPRGDSDTDDPAQILIDNGAQWVLTLGQPAPQGGLINLLLGPSRQTASWPCAPAQPRTHDTAGLTATALAAYVARGNDMRDATEQALRYARQALEHSFQPGMGLRMPRRFPAEA